MKTWAALWMGALLALSACGRQWKPDFSTPEAAWRSFDRAMREKRFDVATDCYAYEEIARARNPDWDTAPSLQRQTIVQKLKEGMQRTLEMTTYTLPTEFEIKAQGSQARVVLTTGSILLTQTPTGWKILDGYPAPFPF